MLVVGVVGWGCGGIPPPVERGGCSPLGQSMEGAMLGATGVESSILLFGPYISCARAGTAEVELLAPDGTVSRAQPEVGPAERGNAAFNVDEVLGATVRFTPSMAGRWTLTARWSTGGETRQEVEVAPSLPRSPAIRRRFIDRMDTCVRGPFRSSSAVTLCQRDGNHVWAYGPDGQVLADFPGAQLAVVGDEVWSSTGAALEHRTATPTALVFDGAVVLEASIEGPTKTRSAVRGSADRLVEVTWDGVSLQAHALAENYGFSSSFIVPQSGEFWSPTGCQFERGCSQTQCPPVITCATNLEFFGLGADAAWGSSASGSVMGGRLVVTAFARPFSRAGVARSSAFSVDVGAFGGTLSSAPMLEVPRVMLGETLFVPRIATGGEIAFSALGFTGRLLTVTPEWTLTAEDSFTLLAMPTPRFD